MPSQLRVGVLSPFVGGDYYGAVIAGINAAAVADGGRVLAVQTLDPGSIGADYCGVPEARLDVAWDHFDAAVVLPGAVGAPFVRALQDAGKLVVLVAHTLPGVTCPAVCADNRSGVRSAVAHLLAHGHRRIGFAGHVEASDVQERYEGYLEALRAHGAEDEAVPVLLPAPDNHETGGVAVAEALLAAAGPGARQGAGSDPEQGAGSADPGQGVGPDGGSGGAGLPVTALVLGTDRNAIGLMERLAAAGVRLPEDLAVVGFDDLVEARHTTPSLSSVRQPLDLLGAAAYERLRESRARTGGEDGANGTSGGPEGGQARARDGDVRVVPTLFVQRDSCGCPARGLQVSPAEVQAQYEDNVLLQRTLEVQYRLGSELLGTHDRNPRGMAWLSCTPARAGCLGLWRDTISDDPAPAGDDPTPTDGVPIVLGSTLQESGGGPAAGAAGTTAVAPSGRNPLVEVAGAFRADGGETPSVGRVLPVSSFPPAALFDLADGAAGQIVFLVPVRSEGRDWGMLAAVGRIQDSTPPGRETMNHAGSLLALALDHDAVLRSLHEQQEQLRRAALFDHLTGLPNRTLLLDRLRRAGLRAVRRPGRHYALLFVDLDGFKQVNDRYGHAAGDRVLVEVARRLEGILRRVDTAARLGGDEFVLLLDGLKHASDADITAGRVREAMRTPLVIDGTPVLIGASIGVATSDGGTADPEELLRRADAAMYRAKPGSPA